MGNLTPGTIGPFDRDVAALLVEVFRPRGDLYAWRVDDEETAARLSAWERERRGPCARAWRVGEWRPAGPREGRRPVTAEDVALHVAGLRTLGFYPLHPDGTCNSVSADFDDHRGARVLDADPRRDFEALAAELERLGVPHLAHRSRGGRGYWVHLLLPSGTRACDARAVLHGALRDAGVRGVAEGGTFDGLFPKQDVAARSGPGNLFCLPLSRRWLAASPPGGGFVGVDPRDFVAQAFHLWKARRVGRDAWDELVARYATARRVVVAGASFASVESSRPSPPEAAPLPGVRSPWELALRRARRLGRPLGGGRYALLCVNDASHSSPDRAVENARGSCVLFPPSGRHPRGFPWCAHAHCARLTERDWVEAVGRDAWDDACLAARGMRRAGPWLLHPGGISTWYRDAGGAVVPSRKDRLCDVPLWVAEDVRARGRAARVVEAVVGGRPRRFRVPAKDFASLAWLTRVGVDPGALLPRARGRLLEAIERLSEPVPLRAGGALGEVDQLAAQGRADDLLGLLGVVMGASAASPDNDTRRSEDAADRHVVRESAAVSPSAAGAKHRR